MRRLLITVSVLVATTPGIAAAQNPFDPTAVKQLCAEATDLGQFGQPRPASVFADYLYDEASGASVVDSYPTWPFAEPGPELVARAQLHFDGWTVLISDDSHNGHADVFVLRANCRRGTAQVVGADTDQIRIDNARHGTYLLITDFTRTGPEHGHGTAGVGFGI